MDRFGFQEISNYWQDVREEFKWLHFYLRISGIIKFLHYFNAQITLPAELFHEQHCRSGILKLIAFIQYKCSKMTIKWLVYYLIIVGNYQQWLKSSNIIKILYFLQILIKTLPIRIFHGQHCRAGTFAFQKFIKIR